MALIKCTECGNDISDSVKQCPNCGIAINYKTRSETNARSITENADLILKVIGTMYIAFGCVRFLDYFVNYGISNFNYILAPIFKAIIFIVSGVLIVKNRDKGFCTSFKAVGVTSIVVGAFDFLRIISRSMNGYVANENFMYILVAVILVALGVFVTMNNITKFDTKVTFVGLICGLMPMSLSW